MPQDPESVDHWEVQRESIELIPLTIETYSASTGLWSETLDYTLACVPKPARPVTFSAPTTTAGQTGYLVDGPELNGGNPGNFWGFYKIDGATEDPVKLAFTLTLK
jgi:hypothetical protein